MKKPTAPRKPIEPTPPKEFLRLQPHYLDIYEVESVKSIIEQLAGKDLEDLEDVVFEKEYGYYDDVSFRLVWKDKQGKPNPNYVKQLEKYNVDMVKYDAQLVVYEERVKKYKADMNEYLLWYHEKELKKLKG